MIVGAKPLHEREPGRNGDKGLPIKGKVGAPRLSLRSEAGGAALARSAEDTVLDPEAAAEGVWVGRWRERVALWLDDGGNPCKASRLHAKFEVDPESGGWVLVDNKSSNGTFLNGARVTRAPVGAGDRVGFGSSPSDEIEPKADDAAMPRFHYLVVATRRQWDDAADGKAAVAPLAPAPVKLLGGPAPRPRAAAMVNAAVRAVANPQSLAFGKQLSPAKPAAAGAGGIDLSTRPATATPPPAAASKTAADDDAEAEAAAEEAEKLATRVGGESGSSPASGEKETLLSLLAHVRRHAARARAERDAAVAEGRAVLVALSGELGLADHTIALTCAATITALAAATASSPPRDAQTVDMCTSTKATSFAHAGTSASAATADAATSGPAPVATADATTSARQVRIRVNPTVFYSYSGVNTQATAHEHGNYTLPPARAAQVIL